MSTLVVNNKPSSRRPPAPIGTDIKPVPSENKEHCLIDGQRCSKCCEVINIRQSKNFIENINYARRYGDGHIPKEQRIYLMLVKISKRRAKKINPQLIKQGNHNKQRMAFYKCKNFTGSGCGIYESRPDMCSKYPLYGKTQEEWDIHKKKFWMGGSYRIDCTYFT